MKNSLNREIPDNFLPFTGANSNIIGKKRRVIKEIKTSVIQKMQSSLSDIFDLIPIIDGMTLSFHHHLRNGDYIINMVAEEIKLRNLKNITIAATAIFPIHAPLVELIRNQNITKIYANYLNGPVAQSISEGDLKEIFIMDSHGGRPRAIEAGELKIDVAFIGVPTADSYGNGNGIYGNSACGTLGYAIPDMKYAKNKVVITDNLVDKVSPADIKEEYIDYVLVVPKIGDSNGILSGTTKPTKDPVQLKIARDTASLIDNLGLISDGFSFQTGAGATSLAVAAEVRKKLKDKNVKASFASGGITGFLVNMLEEKLFENLYDVQCFDLDAVASYRKNRHHIGIDSSKYGNPFDNPIIDKLDVVVLGATEIDLDFNVNVTTDSNGYLIGGSGGHCDTAHGAKLTIITTNLVKSRMPIVKKSVTTITTPGESVDVLVTERGIAINPKRQDLIAKLHDSKLNIVSIEELYKKALEITGTPTETCIKKEVIGLVRYRDGSIIDCLYKVNK